MPRRGLDPKKAIDDINFQIGIMIGCEWPLIAIAKHFDLQPSAITKRKNRTESRQVIEAAAGWTRLAVSRYVQARVHEAENEIAERKKTILSKGYKTIEKALNSGLADEAEIGAVHLKAAEMGIERTEGKPLDRRAVLELNGDDLRGREIDCGELDQILAEAARINDLRKQAPLALPPFLDAELVKE